MRLSNCGYSWSSEDGTALAFPLAAILQETRDLYEPKPRVEGAGTVGIWQRWRKTTYKPAEHLGILLAMAQKQEDVYHASCIRADNILDKFKLQEFEVSGKRSTLNEIAILTAYSQPVLISISSHHVSFLKAEVFREYLNALKHSTSPKLPEDMSVTLLRSRSFDMTKEEDVVLVFHAIVGLVAAYDKLV